MHILITKSSNFTASQHTGRKNHLTLYLVHTTNQDGGSEQAGFNRTANKTGK